MKRKLRSFLQSASGFSLTEVLIAIVILGLAGVTIINGMTTDTKVRGKTNTATNISVGLNAAAEVLLASNVSLIPCQSTSFTPPDAEGNRFPTVYKNAVRSLSSVKVVLVEALTRDENPRWVNCTNSDALVDSAVQRITLQSINAGTILKKVILKNSFTAERIDSTFKIYSSKSTVTIAAATPESSCGSWDSINLSNSLDSDSIVYSALSDLTFVTAATPGSDLRIDGVRATVGTPTGTSTVTVRGVNAANGKMSDPIDIKVTVLSGINFVQPIPAISVLGSNGRVITGPLTITGGTADKTILSSDPTKLTVTSSATSSAYSLDAKQLSSSGVQNIAFSITDRGLPNASNCRATTWSIPVKVQPKLAFTLNSVPRCLVGGSNCAIVQFTPETGSGSSISVIPEDTFTYTPSSRVISIPNRGYCGAKTTSFANNTMTDLNAIGNLSEIRLKLTSSLYPQYSIAREVNFDYTEGNGASKKTWSANRWIIKTYLADPGTNSVILTLSSPGSSTIEVMRTSTASSISIESFKPIYPKFTDINNSPNNPGLPYSTDSGSGPFIIPYCNAA